jgi:gliding motility-associated-like protein
MKKTILVFYLLLFSYAGFALNFTIVESQSFNAGHDMDAKWSSIITGMGHTATIVSQTTLDNTTFFATTDILIISSGVINLPANRITTILQFLQTGKSVYLQSEYLSSYTTNQAFASLVTSLGGTFTWNNPFTGDLTPMNILGTYATINNSVSTLPYFWYSYSGTGDCNTIYMLQYGGGYHGFQYIPVNPAYGSIMSTTDQDWIVGYSGNAILLMQNLVTHLINPPVSNAGVQVDIGNDTTICSGSSLFLDATTTNATYQWQDGSTNPTFNVTQQGTYWVRVTVNTCTGIDTIHVNYFPSQIVDFGNDTTICQGSNLLLDATITNATYLWQDASTDSVFNVLIPGTYWVNVSVNGCSDGDTINVNFSPLPLFNLGNDTTLCQGSSLILDATTLNATYSWQNATTNSTLNVSQQGIYWVDVDVNGCSSRDSIVVSFTPLPSVGLGNDTTLCQGSSLILNATTLNATYLWQNATTNSTFNVSQPGVYWVSVTVNGCSEIDSIDVNYLSAQFIDLGNDTTLCQGNNLLLDATTSNATYLWQDASTNSTLNVSQQGVYWVEVEVSGCISRDSIIVSFSPLPAVDLGNDTTLCQGSTLTLDATTLNATYLWQNATTNSTLNVSQQGLYWVDVAVNGCSGKDTIIINFNPLPLVNLGNDSTLCQGSNILLDATTANATYLWQDASVSSTYYVSQPGEYTVTVMVNGCSKSDEIVINYSDCNEVLYIPNIFSPNGDGQNDVLYARGEGVEEFVFIIYDRWGERVFETKNISDGWDGNFRGKQCDPAVFAYYVKVVFESGIEDRRKGTITLVR